MVTFAVAVPIILSLHIISLEAHFLLMFNLILCVLEGERDAPTAELTCVVSNCRIVKNEDAQAEKFSRGGLIVGASPDLVSFNSPYSFPFRRAMISST